MKRVVTTVTNNDRYLYNLKLVESAWEEVGYKFEPFLVINEDEEFPELDYDFGPNKVRLYANCSDIKDFISCVQSLRFFYAGSRLFDPNDFVLITDADIIPISKSHFSVNDNFDGIIHLNANAYYYANGMRYPACYYGMRSKDWASKINPNKLNVHDWCKKNVMPNFFISGIDEKIVYDSISGCPMIRRVISKDQRIDVFNYKNINKLKQTNEIIDFHFHYIEPKLVEDIYKSIKE